MEIKISQTINICLSRANQAFQSKDSDKAMGLIEQALIESPNHPHALSFKLGLQLSARKIREADKTLNHLMSAECCIDDPKLFINITQTLLQFSRFKQASTMITAGLKLYPKNTQILALAVHTAIEARDLNSAKQFANTAMQLDEQSPQSLLTLANLFLMSGDFEQAREQFLALIEKEPINSHAFAGLSKTKRFDSKDSVLISKFKAAIDASTSSAEKARIGLGLAKLYNDFDEYDLAWQAAEVANLHKLQNASFHQLQFSQQVDNVLSHFSQANIGVQHSNNLSEHVFVVGMPRSGTTLVEQMLSVIPGFYAGGETPAIDYCLAFGKSGNNYLRALGEQKPLDLDAMATAYDNYFRQFMNFSGERIVNKVPTNFFYIGLIKLIFPHAKIINMQRAPLDIAVSIYFENFSQYFAYTNDLDDTFHVYNEYRRMMSHWCGLFGDDILNVDYQNVVENYEQEVDRIGQFIKAKMPSVDQIRKSFNHVETPSVWQVRQPINTNAVNRWKRYEQYLAPYVESYQ